MYFQVIRNYKRFPTDCAAFAEQSYRNKMPFLAWISMLFKRPSLFSDQFSSSSRSGGGDSRTSVKPDPLTSAASSRGRWRTYPLLSSLVNALPHSYPPRRARFPSRSLVLVAPDRPEFLSVRDDEPRDNGTAGTCRDRPHGGGRMAHNRLKGGCLYPVCHFYGATPILIAIVKFLYEFLPRSVIA